jgi:chemotaxis protein CheX
VIPGASFEGALADVVERAWTSTAGLPVKRSDTARASEMQETLVRGCLHIRGAWQGVVVLEGSSEIARQAAAGMFGMESELLSDEEIRDAWGEITNIVGGNISRFLPEPCQLSTPAVEEIQWRVQPAPDGQLIAEVRFVCKNSPFVVGLSGHGESRHDRCVLGGYRDSANRR